MTGKHAVDIMTRPVVTVGPDELLLDAARLILRHHVSGLPVVEADGTLVGLISEHDVMNFALSGEAADTQVREAMTADVAWVPPEADIPTLIEVLTSRRIRRVPIVDGGRVVGIVSRRDILREMVYMYSRYH